MRERAHHIFSAGSGARQEQCPAQLPQPSARAVARSAEWLACGGKRRQSAPPLSTAAHDKEQHTQQEVSTAAHS